jgi:molybdate transport system ATP-binding protein
MTVLLKVDQALCRIGRKAVLKIDSLELERGQHYCLFGPNGAGKSLLAALLAGKRRESGSYVKWAEDLDPRRQIFLVSFEEQQRLWERDNRLDISEYRPDAADQGTSIEALISSARTRQEQDEALLDELLQVLNLAAFRQQGIRFLSSGQVRKALLARALYGVKAAAGGLLILDEPLESIDRESRTHILNCIEQLLDSNFCSLSLHRRAGDIPPYASHLLLMQDLRLLAQGPVEAVQQSPEFRAMMTRQLELPSVLPGTGEIKRPEQEGKLLELHNVSAAWSGKPVLTDINWQMTASDHVLFEGPNGCGKSTFLSLIDGDNHQAYGQDVLLFGRRKGSGESVWEVKSHFGVVSNELHNKYVKGWRVQDVVVSGFYDSLGLYDDSGALEREQAMAWLKVMDLEDSAAAYYHELSFGQQRLVLLARAMVKQPRILILDEPCVGLDDYHRRAVLSLLDKIAGQCLTQLLYVSHVAGEQPACINRHYRFVPAAGGAHTLQQLL